MAPNAVANQVITDPTQVGGDAPSNLGLARVRAVVLLAGSVRPSDLSRGINRSLLDLPVEDGRSVLSLWCGHAESVAEAAGADSLPVRIIVNRSAPEPTIPVHGARTRVSVERDAADFRGTGGILRDAAAIYAPDDLVLVGNGSQILTEPLSGLAVELLRSGGAVSIIAHRDGTPSGLFLIRCSVLSAAADVGFMDFKEQLLPRLSAAGHAVTVIHREHATGRPVRTLDGYLAGLRAFHRVKQGLPPLQHAFDDEWNRTFSIVEPGANVDPTATVHDSVVLSGARIDRGATAVRSVICAGARLRAGQTVADTILTEAGERGRGRPA